MSRSIMQTYQFWTCPSALVPNHRYCALFCLSSHISRFAFYFYLLRMVPSCGAEEHSISFPKLPFSSIRLVLPPNLLRLIYLSIFPIGKVSSIALLPEFSSILGFLANSLMCYCARFTFGGSIRCDPAPTNILTAWNTWKRYRYALLSAFIRHAVQ